jgi:phage repressor protein C with HTH and peptisase S24 domain
MTTREPRGDPRPELLSHEALRQIEQELAQLECLVRQLAVPTLPAELGDPTLARAQAAFWDRYARRARDARSAADEARDEELARSFASRLLRRLAESDAALAPVALLQHRQRERAPDVRGRVAEVLDAAARQGAAPRMDLRVAAGVGRELWDEECESWVELPEGTPGGRYLALAVAGESMTPLLHPGDVVLVRVGPELVRDSVIIARHPENGYVVKRVGRVAGEQVELLSLNADFAPMHIPRDERLVLGTVVARWCTHGDGARP